MGFETGGFCAHPTQLWTFYVEKDDDFKCDEDQSGNYNSKCRPWYTLQKQYRDYATLTDLYPDA